MSNKIILSPDELIICPKCNHKFSLHKGITQQTIEKYESEYEATFAADRKALEERLAKEAERKANKIFTDQIAQLTEQLGESKRTAEKAKALISKAQTDAKARAQAEFELEKKSLSEELAEKDTKLKAFREQELKLRAEKKELEEARQNMQLEIVRKVDEERQKIQKQIVDSESEKFKLKEAELRKQIDDARKVNEDLRRKLEQGSQQLQGEVQELALEALLRTKFPLDVIEPVPKGEHGGDVLHRVVGPLGQNCGTILWESKRTKNWSDGWLPKLRDDQRAAKADVSVIVSQTLPKDVETFDLIDGVYVTHPKAVIPVAMTLRHTLIEVATARQASEGQQTKMEMVYQYLIGPRFRQRVQAIVEAFSSMQDDLDKEKKAITKQWAKREEQIERVMQATVGMYGDLQGIAGKTLQEIEGLSLRALEAPDKGS